MTWLILGLALFILSHLFKRLAPGLRAPMGDAGKGLVALVSLAGIIGMVIGYRGGDFGPVYTPLPYMGHLVNLTMLVAVFLFVVGNAGGVIGARMRHPMLTGMLIWALSHLLVNGDSAAIVLFGTLALWSVLEMVLINRAGPWEPPEKGPVSRDVRAAFIAIVGYAGIAAMHWWLGYNPFLGTYG